MKTDLFQSCGHCWVFHIGWHIECSTFTASSFRIWNSLTGIPLPPLALFIVMLPKAHLTSQSRMSGSWDHIEDGNWEMMPKFCCFRSSEVQNQQEGRQPMQKPTNTTQLWRGNSGFMDKAWPIWSTCLDGRLPLGIEWPSETALELHHQQAGGTAAVLGRLMWV